MRLHRREAPQPPRRDAGAGEEEQRYADGHRQAPAFIDAEDDGHRAKAEADGREDEDGEPADDRGGEAGQLLAQLGAEELESRAAEVQHPGQQVASGFQQAGRHFLLNTMPATSPIAAAMPTAAQGCARTWLSSSAPAPCKCSRAARSDASARSRASCTRGPAWSALARSSSSASVMSARRSFMKLSAASMRLSLVGTTASYALRPRRGMRPRS